MSAPDRSRGIPALIAVLAGIGVIALIEDHRYFPVGRPEALHLPWVLLMLGFAATEAFVIHLELGENAHSFTLNEIPMVLGLVFLAPGELVAARLLGGMLVMAWTYRKVNVKLLFNSALFVTEVGVCLLVFHAVGSLDIGVAGTWLGAVSAVVVMNGISAVAVSGVINLSGGQPDRMLRVVGLGALSTCATANLGLLAVELASHQPGALWMLVPIVGVLFLAYRQYGALHTRYVSLQQLHEFTRVLASSPELTTTIRHSLQQARLVMRAGRAQLSIIEHGDGWSDIRLTLEGEDELDTAHVVDLAERDPLMALVIRNDGQSVLIARGSQDLDEQAILESRSAEDMAACALVSAGRVVGVITVCDHLGDVSTFAEEDLKVFETLANHVSVSLEKARLIDQLRSEAAEKEYQSLHDVLTGLGNRMLFTQVAEEVLEGIRSDGGRLAVLLMDLNRFKDVNDTLGHHSGDLLLRLVADRLSSTIPPGATAIRLGGDEFVFLIPYVAGPESALYIAEELLDRLTRPFTIGSLEVGVGAAVGVALGPDHGDDPGTLLQHADIAMYAAKAAGEGSAILFDPSLTITGTRRLSLGGELRAAIEQQLLEVHYQPIATMRTGAVVGMEALVRWRHPEHGWIAPEDIVALAEHLGLVRPLTQFVLESATAQACQWRRDGHDICVAVNLAAQSLVDANLPGDIGEILNASGLEPDGLILEITETQVIRDPEQTLDVLNQLHDAGITVAVDDFGTGYSSLSYLTRLPVGEIKIDKSFVQQMLVDPTSRKIVRSIVDLGENLGMTVVAEGVEGLLVWDALDQMGCTMAQGYYLSRPASADAITEWLQTRARRQHAALGLAGVQGLADPHTLAGASPPPW